MISRLRPVIRGWLEPCVPNAVSKNVREYASSIAAGVGTALIISVTPYHALAYGAAGAFVRIVSVSLVFVVLYLAGVIALHQGLRPLRETVSLIHELLPERAARGKFAGVVDTEAVLANPDGMA